MEHIDVERFRRDLEFHRQEASQFLNRLGHETRSLEVDSPQDIGDRSVTSLSKESLFQQSSHRRTLLRLIEAALRRIQDGSFGACIVCGDDIPSRRLKALPWTQHCLRCQEMFEQEEATASSGMAAMTTATIWRRAG